MANICMNRLDVVGNEKEVDAFVERFEKDGISAFYPTPKELEDVEAPAKTKEPEEVVKRNVEKYGHPDWYEWRVANWGIKWDVDNIQLEYLDKGEAGFSFDSPWDAPGKAFETISKVFPELTFKLDFIETGMAFFGETVCKNGEIVNDVSYRLEDRFGIGWWLYKDFPECNQEFDDLEDRLIIDEILTTSEDIEKLGKIYDACKNPDEVREVLQVLDAGSKDDVLNFIARKNKGEEK